MSDFRINGPIQDVNDEALGAVLYEAMCECDAYDTDWLIHKPFGVDDGDEAKEWYIDAARAVRKALASSVNDGPRRREHQ